MIVMPKDDDFFASVYELTRQIPFGRVSTYGAIARALGAARSARIVGWALNNSRHQPDDIPAHRVVNRNGLLTGKSHFAEIKMMQELLENEGIFVVNDQIRDFEKLFWDPQNPD